MSQKPLRVLGAGVVLGAAAAVAAGSAAYAQEDPIRIGSFLSITGPASFLGDPEQKTLEMYVDRINADGGVLGRQLELVVYDDAGDANEARTFATRLIDDDEVDIIIGGSTTGATMAVVPLVEEAHIPFISLAGAVVIIDPVNAWVFKTPHTDRMACQKIFEDMQARDISSIGMISGTGGFGTSMREQCLEVAGDYGITVVADETYGPRDSDMTPQLTNIRNTDGVEAVLNPGFGQGPAIVTRNFAQLGIDVPLYQSHGVASASFIELAGDAAEGVRLPAAALLVAEDLPADDPQRDVVVTYKTEFEEQWDQPVSTFGGHAYDALFIAVDAMERAGTTQPEALRDAIEQTTGFMGTAGEVNFSPEDHLGLDLSAFRMLEIRGGTWTIAD
ncbi:MAG: ABC transporter substrate-binding protein [Rhodospirillaceae bacterium]|nr:ABC transporter substrate-binding protein [Rhodospirillaceae bacterium]